jgi:hypothetical protein
VGAGRDLAILGLALWSVDRHEEAKVIIPHRETFSATTQPPYSSTKGWIMAKEKLAACGAGDETNKSDLVCRGAWGTPHYILTISDTWHSKPCVVGREHASLYIDHFRHLALQTLCRGA